MFHTVNRSAIQNQVAKFYVNVKMYDNTMNEVSHMLERRG